MTRQDVFVNGELPLLSTLQRLEQEGAKSTIMSGDTPHRGVACEDFTGWFGRLGRAVRWALLTIPQVPGYRQEVHGGIMRKIVSGYMSPTISERYLEGPDIVLDQYGSQTPRENPAHHIIISGY
jgi:hypothetical protein